MATWKRTQDYYLGFKDVGTNDEMLAFLRECVIVEPTLGTLYHFHTDRELVGTLLKLAGELPDVTTPLTKATFEYLLATFSEITPPDSYPAFASVEYFEEVDRYRIFYKSGQVLEGRRLDSHFGSNSTPVAPPPPEAPKEPTFQISKENYK